MPAGGKKKNDTQALPSVKRIFRETKESMGDYTNMSAYYDWIMTSGYYDYKKIVEKSGGICLKSELKNDFIVF